MSIAAQENHISRATSRNKIEKTCPGRGEVGPFFIWMFACDYLNSRSDKVDVRVAVGQLLFQPLPLFCAERVGGRARFFPMITAIEKDDFHAFARGTKIISDVNSRLLSARTVRRFVEKIEEKPLALDFVQIVLSAILHTIVVIIPNADDMALFAKRFVIELFFFRAISALEIGQIVRFSVNNIAKPDPKVRFAFANRAPERLRFVFAIARAECDPLKSWSGILAKAACDGDEPGNKQ